MQNSQPHGGGFPPTWTESGLDWPDVTTGVLYGMIDAGSDEDRIAAGPSAGTTYEISTLQRWQATAIRERAQASGPRFTCENLRKPQRFMVNMPTRDFRKPYAMGLLRPLLAGMELRVLAAASCHEHLRVVIDQRPAEDFSQ